MAGCLRLGLQPGLLAHDTNDLAIDIRARLVERVKVLPRGPVTKVQSHEGLALEVGIETSVFTRAGVRRVVAHAFELAEGRRGLVTSATKSNASRYGYVLWDEVAAEVAAEHPDVRYERVLVDALVDEGSFLEIHARWAKELIVGYARLDGRVVGIVANQPKFKGGVLFVDSADKAARFIWTCNAFNVPLPFLAAWAAMLVGRP